MSSATAMVGKLVKALILGLASFSSAAEPPAGLVDSDGCEANPILKTIRSYAPDCISQCSEVCIPLNGLITTVLMGGDPVPEVCAQKDIFDCMVEDEHIDSCNHLLDAAKDYATVEIPRTAEAFHVKCDVLVPPTMTTTQTRTTETFTSTFTDFNNDTTTVTTGITTQTVTSTWTTVQDPVDDAAHPEDGAIAHMSSALSTSCLMSLLLVLARAQL